MPPGNGPTFLQAGATGITAAATLGATSTHYHTFRDINAELSEHAGRGKERKWGFKSPGPPAERIVMAGEFRHPCHTSSSFFRRQFTKPANGKSPQATTKDLGSDRPESPFRI